MIITQLVCDKCKKQSEDVQTRKITFDGQTLEVELCDADAKLITDLVELGRTVEPEPVPVIRVPQRRGVGAPKTSSDYNGKVRAWARENPVEYNGNPWYAEKGRIPDVVVAAYEAAQ